MFSNGQSRMAPSDRDAPLPPVNHAANNQPPLNLDNPMHTSSLLENETLDSHTQNIAITPGSHLFRHRQTQASVRKRAPKAPTMTAKRWEPCEARLRELYIQHNKSLKELREIINKEFDLTATERQYKVKIQQMRLERNVKSKEQKAIIEHVIRRKQAGKRSAFVRIRGHKVDSQKLSRWLRDVQSVVGDQSERFIKSPSPLPSCISIRTEASSGSWYSTSLNLPQNKWSGIELPAILGSNDLVMQRLLAYSDKLEHIITLQDARDVFNDLQCILSSDRIAWGIFSTASKKMLDAWNPEAVEDITRLRNLMNLYEAPAIQKRRPSTTLTIQEASGRMIHDAIGSFNSITQTKRQSSWMTAYGRVIASFEARIVGSNVSFVEPGTADQRFHARITVIPQQSDTFSSCIVFDLTSKVGNPTLSASLTYYPIIPGTSKVFEVIRRGQVYELREMFEKGDASLNDRDEQGRSLLHHALYHGHEHLCSFLLDHHADVNSIEVDFNGLLVPVYVIERGLHSEVGNDGRATRISIMNRLIEVGADILLQVDIGVCSMNGFEDILRSHSAISLKKVLDYWSTMIDINRSFLLDRVSPLIVMAKESGYDGSAFQVLEKVMILLERKADVNCQGTNGNTVLHEILKCQPLYRRVSEANYRKLGFLWQWKLSKITPKDMLILFISAGADVFATDRFGETPYEIALDYRRTTEWREALSYCGYDAEEVRAHRHTDLAGCTSQHPACKLGFEECCRQLRARNLPPEGDGNDHLWESVDTSLYVGEEDYDDIDTSEEDEANDECDSKCPCACHYDTDDDTVDDDSSAMSPNSYRDEAAIFTELEDTTRQHAHETRPLHNDTGADRLSPVVGENNWFSEETGDGTTLFNNLLGDDVDSLNGFAASHPSPVFDQHTVADFYGDEVRRCTDQEITVGSTELISNEMDVEDCFDFDFDAYYDQIS